mgnify:CR=1 FL=1
MKRLQVTTTLDDSLLPPLYSMVAESSAIAELRVIDWNLAATDEGTLLYEFEGDANVFRDGVRETDGIDDVDFAYADEGPTYALISARPAAIPFFSTFMALTARAGLVVRKPLVYRDYQSSGRVVGEPEPLQRAIDETPGGVDVRVERIGTLPSEADDGTRRLSERQRAALETALEMGYYNQPREVTHEDIASELGCAANTATTHLQKGEAKLVQAVLNYRETRNQ